MISYYFHCVLAIEMHLIKKKKKTVVFLLKGPDSDEQPQRIDMGEPHLEALGEEVDKGLDLVYSLNDRPPWYLCILLGFQVK